MYVIFKIALNIQVNVSNKPCLYLFACWHRFITLENLCTRKAQSSRGGHSRRVEKNVHLAVEKGNKFLNISLLRVFFADYCQ